MNEDQIHARALNRHLDEKYGESLDTLGSPEALRSEWIVITVNTLNAPCVFCLYAGHGYWRTSTHAPACPWFNVVGERRSGLLRDVIESDWSKRRQQWAEDAPGSGDD